MDDRLKVDIAVARTLLDEVERQLGADGRVTMQLAEELSHVVKALVDRAERDSGVSLVRKAS